MIKLRTNGFDGQHSVCIPLADGQIDEEPRYKPDRAVTTHVCVVTLCRKWFEAL